MAWYDDVEKARKKKNPKMPDMTIVMLSPPGFNGYTGAGANGVVEPDKPAVLDPNGPMGQPGIYHEGEMVSRGLQKPKPTKMYVAKIMVFLSVIYRGVFHYQGRKYFYRKILNTDCQHLKKCL